jgi:hypothetical protein
MVSFTQEIAEGARSLNHSIYPHAAEKDLIYSVPIHVLNTWKAYKRISNNNTTDAISTRHDNRLSHRSSTLMDQRYQNPF